MTETVTDNTSRHFRRKAFCRRGDLLLCWICAFFLLLFLKNAELAARYLSDGLTLCVKSLIPSVFPFMIISELMVSGGAIGFVGSLFARPCGRLFGIGKDSAGALLLGFLCGFPLGTKCAVSLYRQGRISADELRRVLSFCNVPSPAFLINVVGASLLHDHDFGVVLYGITLFSALLIGIGGRLFRKAKSASPLAPSSTVHASSRSPLALFTEAVGTSATAMLRICAFVVFFSALVGILEQCFLALSPALSAFTFGIFELTGGVSRAALCAPKTARLLCAALAGWSGFSVHFQIMGLCDDTPFSFGSYIVAKLIHGILNLLLVLGYFFLFCEI